MGKATTNLSKIERVCKVNGRSVEETSASWLGITMEERMTRPELYYQCRLLEFSEYIYLIINKTLRMYVHS